MRNLEFYPQAYSVFCLIKSRNVELYSIIKSIILDTVEHPEYGLGDPVALKNEFRGLWKRKITASSSLLYTFNNETVLVSAILYHENISLNEESTLKLDSFSDDDYRSVMAQMSANRGKDNEPKVGIFWYNRARKELFGIISHKISDYSKANASNGRITCSEMHEDIWKREFRRQKYHGDGTGPYIGAYQDKPRGRVFYNIASDTFEVAVGKWLEDFPEAYQLILEEFNLPKEKTVAKYAIHWDIGMSWR